jgi:hypothetical protein
MEFLSENDMKNSQREKKNHSFFYTSKNTRGEVERTHDAPFMKKKKKKKRKKHPRATKKKKEKKKEKKKKKKEFHHNMLNETQPPIPYLSLLKTPF